MRRTEDRGCVAGNGVYQTAAWVFADGGVRQHLEKFCENFQGVCPSPVNVGFRMASGESVDVDQVIDVVRGCGRGFKGEFGDCFHAARTSGADASLFFAVMIDQQFSREKVGGERFGAGEAGLFVHGEYVPRKGNAYLVVGAQCCATCMHPVVLDHGFCQVCSKVDRLCGIFFADHVHVRLQNDDRRSFKPHCRKFSDADVSCRVLFCEPAKIPAYLLFVPGRERDAGDIFKVL